MRQWSGRLTGIESQVEETEGVDSRTLFDRSWRLGVIQKHLHAYDADAMLLQEVGTDEHAALIAAFGDTHDVSSLWPITWSYTPTTASDASSDTASSSGSESDNGPTATRAGP